MFWPWAMAARSSWTLRASGRRPALTRARPTMSAMRSSRSRNGSADWSIWFAAAGVGDPLTGTGVAVALAAEGAGVGVAAEGIGVTVAPAGTDVALAVGTLLAGGGVGVPPLSSVGVPLSC